MDSIANFLNENTWVIPLGIFCVGCIGLYIKVLNRSDAKKTKSTPPKIDEGQMEKDKVAYNKNTKTLEIDQTGAGKKFAKSEGGENITIRQ